MVDLPVKQLLEDAENMIKELGGEVYFKFTCENCGARCTFEKPNTLYEFGRCEDCGHVTKIKEGGYMFMKVIK